MIENNNGDYAVLFVDDEDKALKYFSKAIADRFKVFTAEDVSAAEEILQEHHHEIAVVISDQRMPGRNGVDLLKKVRTQYPAMVRLLTTAYSDLNDAIEAINRGEIYRYIQKPWHVESLRAEVAGAVDYFLLRRERDLLLAEKLSARQRMTGIERISQLVSFARLSDSLRNVDYGVRDFLDQLHTLPGAWESDGLGRVDQWELTKWETKRSTDFVRSVLDRLATDSAASSFQDTLTTANLVDLSRQLAGECQVDLAVDESAGPAAEWLSDRQLLENLMRSAIGLCSSLRQDGGAVSMRLSRGSADDTAGSESLSVTLRVEAVDWPGDRHLLSGSALTSVHPVYEQVLACALAAAHHGGRCALELGDNSLEVRLAIPLAHDAASLELPELGWEWLPEILCNYEPQIDEFYHDL